MDKNDSTTVALLSSARRSHIQPKLYDKVTVTLGLHHDVEIEIEYHSAEIVPFRKT
jgi:hypothetical protein